MFKNTAEPAGGDEGKDGIAVKERSFSSLAQRLSLAIWLVHKTHATATPTTEGPTIVNGVDAVGLAGR